MVCIGDRIKCLTHMGVPRFLHNKTGTIIDIEKDEAMIYVLVEFDVKHSMMHNGRGRTKEEKCYYIFREDFELLPSDETLEEYAERLNKIS